MNIAFDIDGVLTDFEKFLNEFGTAFLKQKKICDGSVLSASSAFRKRFGCTEKLETKFYKRYLLWYSKHFPMRENAAAVIRSLREQGHKVYIITARALSDRKDILGYTMRRMVAKWLQINGIQYDGIDFVSVEDSAREKRSICQERKIDVIVEDDVANIESILTCCKVICMDADYNRDISVDCMRAYDMNDIFQYIQSNRIQERKSISELDQMQLDKKESYIKKLKWYYQNTPFDQVFANKCKKYLTRYVRIFGGFIARSTHIRVKGYENIPEDKNVVFVCNHRKAFDIPLMYMVLKKRMPRILVKEECEFSGWGGLQRKIGMIFVKREDKKSCRNANSVMVHSILHGEDILIFPEGTRNRTTQLLLPFKRGAVYVAQVTGHPIIPIVMKRNGRDCNVVIGELIEITAGDTIRKQTEKLRNVMVEMIKKV